MSGEFLAQPRRTVILDEATAAGEALVVLLNQRKADRKEAKHIERVDR